MLPLDLQLYMCAVMTLTGASIAAVFDLARVVRKVFRWQAWWSAVVDVVMALLIVCLFASGWILAAWGARHSAVLVGFLLGIWLYVALASPFLAYVWARMFSWVRRLELRLRQWVRALPVWSWHLRPPWYGWMHRK